MKNIASKKTTQKIFLIVLTVLLFSCIVPNYSMALRPSDNGTDTHSYNPVKIDSEITVEDVSFDGGTLLTPIKKLCYTVGDAIMTIAQKIVIGNKFTVPCANVTPVGDKGTGEGHDAWDDAIKTKNMVSALNNLKVEGKTLIVLPEKNENVQKSARNIEGVKTSLVNTINVYDLLKYNKLVLTVDAVKSLEEVYA